ncbi:hypothetical protein HanPSC8_Chr13g0592881 [Helianthus annuus]|nr:hypothetical protein HanPSC8_Chr13g0592881 [Helianthus annuus]
MFHISITIFSILASPSNTYKYRPTPSHEPASFFSDTLTHSRTHLLNKQTSTTRNSVESCNLQQDRRRRNPFEFTT